VAEDCAVADAEIDVDVVVWGPVEQRVVDLRVVVADELAL
jgi:hypothetical protein